MAKTFTTKALADALDAELIGDGDLPVSRLAHPADVRDASDLALAMDPKLLPIVAQSSARAVVIAKNATAPDNVKACLVVSRPRLAMSTLTNLFAEPVPAIDGVHPTAVIEKGATLGAHVSVGAMAFVGAGAVIGDNSVLHPQTYVGAGAVVGRNALIYPGARVGSGVTIGDRFIMHFNASVGADGFSFVTPEMGSVEQAKSGATSKVTAANNRLLRIASLGGVQIGDDVEIGASSCIDRGTIRPTRIGNGTKIDNHVQVGHNVVIGENCLICGRVGIAGSATIGNRVVLGGASGVADHVTVGDDVVAMAMAGIAGSIAPGSVVGGFPARPRDRMMESFFNIGRLKHFYARIEALTERFDRFEQSLKDR